MTVKQQWPTLAVFVALSAIIVVQEIRIRNLEDGNIPRIKADVVEASVFCLPGSRGGMKIHEEFGTPYLMFYDGEKPKAGIGVSHGAGTVFVVDEKGAKSTLP